MTNSTIKKDDILNSLSIVVQGPLYDWNIVQTAQLISQWRSIFPKSKIIFSISQSDLIIFEGSGIIPKLRIVRIHRNNIVFQDALALIDKFCDIVVMSDSAIVLPPVKSGLRENNCNLQIEAAKAGLRLVDTDYVLRIRNDIVFSDTSLIDYYIDNYNLPRGKYAALKQRVLISEFFTLNPFTFEKLPFHYSDWMHFGLIEDVKKLWDVPSYGIIDATYYQRNTYKKGSGPRENTFISRYAVEQYLAITVFKKFFHNIKLDYHNDTASINESLYILADNFIISDFTKTKIYFAKYQHIMRHNNINIVCMTHEAWKKIVFNAEKNINIQYLFKKEIEIANKSLKNNPNNEDFPPPKDIMTKIFFKILIYFLSENKKNKLKRNPKKFFADSKNSITKRFGEKYISSMGL
ncbi:hypothetical protein KSAC_21810 [Komagataeibacter saccharivorans]|uniref:WavE lipopolysaccharide synthesis family protein n=1 Tax=Komagataeibacter saccharivorans TaxID=265959 RepID=UPI00105382D1|nr:WavE lipopolysaccharide synthesis family protein [Komagataeibacter saccharivorans]QBL94384.1 hypothetical protein KSAC_21810 [Komagataeibacter saccharivorans]